jgi:hypothetical protein
MSDFAEALENKGFKREPVCASLTFIQMLACGAKGEFKLSQLKAVG